MFLIVEIYLPPSSLNLIPAIYIASSNIHARSGGGAKTIKEFGRADDVRDNPQFHDKGIRQSLNFRCLVSP